jgi:hypothetical protein
VQDRDTPASRSIAGITSPRRILRQLPALFAEGSVSVLVSLVKQDSQIAGEDFEQTRQG